MPPINCKTEPCEAQADFMAKVLRVPSLAGLWSKLSHIAGTNQNGVSYVSKTNEVHEMMIPTFCWCRARWWCDWTWRFFGKSHLVTGIPRFV